METFDSEVECWRVLIQVRHIDLLRGSGNIKCEKFYISGTNIEHFVVAFYLIGYYGINWWHW